MTYKQIIFRLSGPAWVILVISKVLNKKCLLLLLCIMSRVPVTIMQCVIL